MASSLHTLFFFLSSLWLTLHAIANFVLGLAGLILLHVRVLELQSVKTFNFARPGLAALLLLNCTKHSNFLFHLKIHETGEFFFFFFFTKYHFANPCIRYIWQLAIIIHSWPRWFCGTLQLSPFIASQLFAVQGIGSWVRKCLAQASNFKLTSVQF